MTETDIPPYIVVGVDGSGYSAEALRAAVAQARLTGSAVHAVMAWQPPGLFSSVPSALEDAAEAAAGVARPMRTFQQQAEEELAEAVRNALGGEAPDFVRATVVQGSPAQALLEAAEGAQLLAVGSRGYGGFRGLLLGSVSQHVAQYAHCSVLIVREPRPAD
ncbi:universal stress protein [Phaeacidiphilus oryzae]|uniref:universal stress protein n=1 Tax=Phaeacidiphilus oryzae TaxID=348818 RepID=UPI00056C9D53|nr:universal stress protein [Phaeacidiphilus oryzae]